MPSYDELNERLELRYRTLSEERDGAPVYAIEHGFDVRAVSELKSVVAGWIRVRPGIGSTIAWPLIALAAEIGYSYEGLFSGYWPRLEAMLGLPLRGEIREDLSLHHEHAHLTVGLARPDDNPFTRTFRHIAWPLCNALVPRQIHGGLCAAILEAVVLDAADSAFLGAVQQGCRRSGSRALIDWADDGDRVHAVAISLLDAPDVRLSSGIVQRLQRDVMASPNARDILVRARVERKRRRNVASGLGAGARDATASAAKDAEASVEFPFELRGGVRLGTRTYALGAPVGLVAHVALRVAFPGRPAGENDLLAPGEHMILAPDEAGQITFGYHDRNGGRRSASLRFDVIAPPPALIATRTEPSAPTLADLREKRLAILVALSPPPDDRRTARWPTSLRNVEIRSELRLTGHPTLYARDRLPAVPGRINGTGSGLAELSDGLRRYENETGVMRAATLIMHWGSGRRVLDLIDPEPSTRWYEGEDRWHATSIDLSEELHVRYVPASDPLAVPDPLRAGEGAHLYVVEGMTAPHFLVAGPRRLHGAHVASLPIIHRRFHASDASRGLSVEIEAWLGWRCAYPIHAIAEIEARLAARAAERAILNTLCGPGWVEEEDRLPTVRPFALRLAEAAIALDLVKIQELREAGERIESEDVSELPYALARSLVTCTDLFGRRATVDVGDREAAMLDASVDDAWQGLTASRVARSLSPVDADTGNPAEIWREAWSRALAARERPTLAAMILPPRLAVALRGLDYATVESLEVARLVSALRIDRGTSVHQSRRLSGTDILSALSLWTNPRAFSAVDWRHLARGLLEDRMTARAIRYAGLRMGDESEET